MRSRFRTAASALLLLTLGVFAAPQAVLGQVVPGQSSDDQEPVPYEEEEFSDWLLSARRAEIVATGTLPLTLLASRLVYSLIRFTVASIVAGAIDLDYAPWFFAPPGAPELTRVEKLGVVGGAIGLSVIIAWIDNAILSAEADAAAGTLDGSSGTE